MIRRALHATPFALFILALAGLVLRAACIGCTACDEGYWGYPGGSFDHYTLGALSRTPGGVSYDPSGQTVDPLLMDTYVDEVESCLKRPVDRSSFVIKVAGDWHLGCAANPWGQQQLLPVVAPDIGCEAKDLTPTTACPCEWRAGIECPNILVVTPNLLLLKDVLIRWTTGTDDPWIPQYSACASP